MKDRMQSPVVFLRRERDREAVRGNVELRICSSRATAKRADASPQETIRGRIKTLNLTAQYVAPLKALQVNGLQRYDSTYCTKWVASTFVPVDKKKTRPDSSPPRAAFSDRGQIFPNVETYTFVCKAISSLFDSCHDGSRESRIFLPPPKKKM